LEESSGRSVALLQIDAVMVDKILKGIKPAYLPVEPAKQFEFITDQEEPYRRK